MERHERLQRIVSLQRRLSGISSGALARTETSLKILLSEEQKLIGQLELNETLMSLFPDVVLSRLQETRRQRLGAEKLLESQRLTLFELRRRLKHIERLADRAKSQYELQKSDDGLKRALDLALSGKGVSSA